MLEPRPVYLAHSRVQRSMSTGRPNSSASTGSSGGERLRRPQRLVLDDSHHLREPKVILRDNKRGALLLAARRPRALLFLNAREAALDGWRPASLLLLLLVRQHGRDRRVAPAGRDGSVWRRPRAAQWACLRPRGVAGWAPRRGRQGVARAMTLFSGVAWYGRPSSVSSAEYSEIDTERVESRFALHARERYIIALALPCLFPCGS